MGFGARHKDLLYVRKKCLSWSLKVPLVLNLHIRRGSRKKKAEALVKRIKKEGSRFLRLFSLGKARVKERADFLEL